MVEKHKPVFFRLEQRQHEKGKNRVGEFNSFCTCSIVHDFPFACAVLLRPNEEYINTWGCNVDQGGADGVEGRELVHG